MQRLKLISNQRNLLLIFLLFVPSAHADVRMAILNFELKDLTLAPGTEAELERTASIAPLLRNELEKKYGYQIIAIGSHIQEKADVSVGYLFGHADVAADLCKQHGADWIVAGRLHKPSFLFAYIIAHLTNCNTKKPAGNYTIEVKGYAKNLTARGVENLAIKINQSIHTE
ncbi:MAG TPA: DUF2380 domain-containing protein [Armatimonadetes bacterium]|nr:DUF2380 domain-containing protein [Armatimonadota bacterium]